MHLLRHTNELYSTGAGNVSSHYLPHFTCVVVPNLRPTLSYSNSSHFQSHSQTVFSPIPKLFSVPFPNSPQSHSHSGTGGCNLRTRPKVEMGVALMTVWGHSLDCRVFLIRRANADTNSGHGVVWWWSMLWGEQWVRFQSCDSGCTQLCGLINISQKPCTTVEVVQMRNHTGYTPPPHWRCTQEPRKESVAQCNLLNTDILETKSY